MGLFFRMPVLLLLFALAVKCASIMTTVFLFQNEGKVVFGKIDCDAQSKCEHNRDMPMCDIMAVVAVES